MKADHDPGECSRDNGSNNPQSVSKQHKITDNRDSLSRNLQLLDPADIIPSLVSVSEAAVAGSGSCKQEGLGPEVVVSDMDFGGLVDDMSPSALFDMWNNISGSEFTSEFQKFLSESEKDNDGNLNFSSGDLSLTCLSASDVTDAIEAKPPTAVLQSTVEAVTAASSFQSLQPLHSETKCVEVPSTAQTVPVGHYSMEQWHQNVEVHEPVVQHMQLLPTYQSDTCPELLTHGRDLQMKQQPSLRRQLQSHDAYTLSVTQNFQQQQQPQSNQLHSWYQTHVPTQHPQQYQMTQEQRTWLQQQWQASSQFFVQQAPQQPISHPFVPASAAVYIHDSKKEMPLSASVSSAANVPTGPARQMMSSRVNDGQVLLPHPSTTACANVAAAAANNQSHMSVHAGCQPRMADCNQLQHPATWFSDEQERWIFQL